MLLGVEVTRQIPTLQHVNMTKCTFCVSFRSHFILWLKCCALFKKCVGSIGDALIPKQHFQISEKLSPLTPNLFTHHPGHTGTSEIICSYWAEEENHRNSNYCEQKGNKISQVLLWKKTSTGNSWIVSWEIGPGKNKIWLKRKIPSQFSLQIPVLH